MKRAISSVLFALPLALAACGGDDGGITVVPDAEPDETTPDACVPAKRSAETPLRGTFMIDKSDGVVLHGPTCAAVADQGTPTLGNQFAVGGDNCTQVNPETIQFGGALNMDAEPDVFVLELYKGFGVFENGEITTGTYTITGDEAQYATCGVCALIYANVTQTAIGATYLATAGTVNITSVYPNVTGTASGLQLTHVDIADGTFMSTPNASGCTSQIASVSFDALLEAP